MIRLACLTALLLVSASALSAQDKTARTPDGFVLPEGAIHRFGNRQARHPEAIAASAISPDGNYLATMSNSSVVVWDTKTLSAKCTLTGSYFGGYGFGDRNANLWFLLDSKSLLVAVRPTDRTSISVNESVELAQVWDIETGKVKFGLKGLWGFAFSSWTANDGKEIGILAGYREMSGIKYHDAKTGKELRTVKVPATINRGMWISPNGTRLASLNDNRDGMVIYDSGTGDQLHTLSGGLMVQAAFSPDGKKLIYHEDTGKVRVHDLEAKKELFTFDHPAEKQRGPMKFSKDRQTLYFGGQHGQLYRWDLKNNKKLPDVGRHSSWTLSTIALSPDETILYSMGGDRLIKRWDLKTGKQMPTPEGYTTQTAAVPSTDGKHLIVVDHAGAIDYWDLATGKHVKQLQAGKSGGIDCVATSSDGRWFAGGRTVQDVQLWDLSTGKLERTIPLVEKPDDKGGDHVKRVYFRRDGKVLFTGSGKTGVTAWEVPTGKKLWNANPGGTVSACDPTGHWIGTGGGFNNEQVQLTVLDGNTGQVLRRLDAMPDAHEDALTISYPPYITDIAFTADGARLLTAHYDGTIRVWDPIAGKELHRMKCPARGSLSVGSSLDSRWVAAGRPDRKITVWELATGKEVLTLASHDSAVRDVAFTRDGRGIVGNADLSPILWSLSPKELPRLNMTPDALWESLASADASLAYRLQWAMAKDPAVTIKLLSEKVKPAELAMDRTQFDKWLAALDSPQFRAREVAEKAMAQAGLKVPVAWLRDALAASKSDEVSARLGRVLTQREKPDPMEWRLGRAVQILELARTADTKALLKTWSEAGGSALSTDAKAALERLEK
jgi:WD40 repeat protein